MSDSDSRNDVSQGFTAIYDIARPTGVGENLQNHVSYTLSWTINQPDEFDLNWAAALEYVAFQRGIMASTGLSQLTGILSSPYTTADHPDLQFFFGGYQASCATTGEIGSLMDDGRRSISISPTNLRPRSRGNFSQFSPRYER